MMMMRIRMIIVMSTVMYMMVEDTFGSVLRIYLVVLSTTTTTTATTAAAAAAWLKVLNWHFFTITIFSVGHVTSKLSQLIDRYVVVLPI